MIKDDIRAIAYVKRKALSKQQVAVDSKRICEQLIPYMNGCIALYESYGQEVDVSTLKPYCERYALPKSESDGTMFFYEINKETKFEKRVYGINEPVNGTICLPEAFDVLIVPIVAFDEECHRLGHGKGYYDRFLTKSKALKIGVAFDCQKLEVLPIDPWDISLDIIVTPTMILKKQK